jgi:hypothetical protein
MAKGVVGAEWTGSVATKVGGKTGGKGATSSGVGNKLDEIDAGVTAAAEVGQWSTPLEYLANFFCSTSRS